ncbi:alpha/beta hydrolase [Thioclava sp. BHET1]|nr:alpha/beta hydrolase [Thioclava sp. BHET1]
MIPRLVQEGASLAPNARWFDLEDRVSGQIRRVFLWLPEGPAPEAGWPALWMLDGNAVIGTAIDAMRTQAFWPSGTGLGWGALVAIGYPTDAPYDSFRRSWDLGPPPGRSYPPFVEDGPEVRTGGGAEMARFLLEDVTEFLATQAPLDPARRTLFGHSFGGLFALWLLFTKPESFSAWVAASPAVTWEESFLLEHLARFTPEHPTRVHLSAGAWEGDALAPFQCKAPDAAERLAEKARTRTLAAAQDMAAALTAKGLVAEYETYAGETHMSVLPVAINRALHWAFALPPAPLVKGAS